MQHWLSHVMGLDNLSGVFYGFWSGIGSDFGEVALLGAVFGLYHHHQCHVDKCRRLGRQRVEGTTYVVCHKHHPTGAPTAEQVQDAYDTGQKIA